VFKKVLIANRGEIALRVIRACRELGLETVAVHSDCDADCAHVKYADQAICIGPHQPSASYLNVPNIVSAAEISGADAIHPGYGFLAENAQFAEVCESCNITFIGPSSASITDMGNKSRAKKIMAKAGINGVPGSDGPVKDEKEALKFAKEAGYPVIVKASAGGGGRGMRLAQNDNELRKLFNTARQEAKSAFGNPEVYIEKYLDHPRHIEIQIMADNYGNVIHFGERDCSIQRRHQKLLEESPAVNLDSKIRQALCKLAVKAAKTINYRGAGTVEFLVDKKGNYYFMEMNTRIQVEHPVTEAVCGIDLVREQINVASGEKLAIIQSKIDFKGHAIEFRINAENSENNFLPVAGKVDYINIPGGFGVRVDTHVYSGYTVPPFYDSLLAKLIVWGNNREEALARAKRTLTELEIKGLPTTIPFHLKVIDNDYFKQGKVYTNFIAHRILGEK